jgi:LacI family transcriptional regulator
MSTDKPATINDVAHAAGVSYQTVSRVINNHPSVRDTTRKRVQEAIRQLHYHPSNVARSLVTRRSGSLGVVSFGMLHYGPAQMFSHIENAARARGYSLNISSISSLTQEELGRAIGSLRRQQVEGILVIAPLLGIETIAIKQHGQRVPVVLVDAEPSAGQPFTSIDQFGGGQLGARHLLELGHRRIALILGPGQWNDAQLRLRGWLSALHEARLEPLAQASGDWSAASGYRATKELLAQHPFTGLLVANDQMALGSLHALREAGLRVPQDISVVGFDNIPEAAYFDPPLSTIEQDFQGLGQKSLAQLVALIETPDLAPMVQVIPPKLVLRSSTAPQTSVLAGPNSTAPQTSVLAGPNSTASQTPVLQGRTRKEKT